MNKKTFIRNFFYCFLFALLLMTGLYEKKVYASQSNPSISFVVLSSYQKTLDAGEEYQLIAITSTGKQPSFKSSDSKIASVNTYGKITAKKAGTVKITAKIKNAEASCSITVRKTIITLDKKNISLQRNERVKLSAVSSNHSELQFKSSKSSVASVDSNGVITGKKPGETTITISALGGSCTCKVTVLRPTIKLSHTEISLYKNQTFSLKANISSGIRPTWSSSKKSVAIVSEDGTVTALKHGTALITAKADGVSKTCVVTVKPPVIVLSKTDIVMYPGQSTVISATVSNHCQPVFKSSKPSVVSTDSSGRIFAQKPGEAMIYASEDGAKTGCHVLVVKNP